MSTEKKSYTGPFLIMVGLMFVVGFLTVVNQQFQAPLQDALLSKAGDLKNTLATLITFAFFMGYPAFGGTASKWADKVGYKKTLIRGLIILMVALAIEALTAKAELGTIMISSSEVPINFFIFLLGSFILGSSMAVLQTVINPFVAVCEVKGTSSVTRMSIAGALNSIGTTIAPFFVATIIFGGSLPAVTQLLLPLSVLILVIALVTGIVSKLHLPNPNVGGDSDVIDMTKLTQSIWKFKHLTLGVIGIFVYVGAEVCVGSNIVLHAKQLGIPAADYQFMASLYWGGMLVGRLLGSFLSKISAGAQLAGTSIVSLILVVIAMTTNNLWFLVGIGLMHSIMWGAIFSMAIDKLGIYTAKGSGALMIGVAGGAILPWIQGISADVVGGWEITWIIVILAEAYLLFYALVGHKHNFDKPVIE